MATATDIRDFLRRLILTPEGRALVSRQVGSNERVMVKALELAASDQKDAPEGAIPVSVDVRILAAVTAMSPESQKMYAETGKLPERYWELPEMRGEK